MLLEVVTIMYLNRIIFKCFILRSLVVELVPHVQTTLTTTRTRTIAVLDHKSWSLFKIITFTIPIHRFLIVLLIGNSPTHFILSLFSIFIVIFKVTPLGSNWIWRYSWMLWESILHHQFFLWTRSRLWMRFLLLFLFIIISRKSIITSAILYLNSIVVSTLILLPIWHFIVLLLIVPKLIIDINLWIVWMI